MQAQDARACALALSARGDAGGSAGRVVGWLLRGTLHLVSVADYWWLHGLCAPRQAAANARRLRQEGVEAAAAERHVAAVASAIERGGAVSRERFGELLGLDGQALMHVLLLASLRGLVAIDALTRAFVAPPSPRPPFDREAALAQLGARYLRGHAPADAADLAAWSGLPLRDARAALDAAGAPPRARAPRRIPPRLLGPFDPYLLGWKDRSFCVPAGHARAVHPGGGMLRAVATVDGVVVGTWTLGGGLELFARVSASDEAALLGELSAIRG